MLGSLPSRGRILRVVYVDVLLDTFLELDRFEYSDELLEELSCDDGELVIDVCTPEGVVSDARMSIEAFEAHTQTPFRRAVREARREHIESDIDNVLWLLDGLTRAVTAGGETLQKVVDGLTPDELDEVAWRKVRLALAELLGDRLEAEAIRQGAAPWKPDASPTASDQADDEAAPARSLVPVALRDLELEPEAQL